MIFSHFSFSSKISGNIINSDLTINYKNIPILPSSTIEKEYIRTTYGGELEKFNQGIDEVNQGRIQEGLRSLIQSLNSNPFNSQIWNAIGVTIAKKGLLLLGIEYIKQSQKYEESALSYHQLCQIYNAAAETEKNPIKKNEYEIESCLMVEKSVSLFSKVDDSSIEAVVSNGICYYKSNKKKQAIFELTKALRANKNHKQALILRGEIYSELKSYQLALGDYMMILQTHETSLSLEEKLQISHKIAVTYIYHLSDLNNGKEWVEKCFKLDPNDIPTLHLIGSLCLMASEYNCAIDYYQRVLELDSSQVATFIELLNAKRTVCDWRSYEKDEKKVKDIVNDDIKANRKSSLVAWYALMWEFIDGVTMKQLAYNFMKEDFLPYSKLRNYQHSKVKKNKNDKLRIGIVTADAGNTNVGRDIIGWFSHLNEIESNIELHLFVAKPHDNGNSFGYIIKHCKHVHLIFHMTNEESADLIYQIGIDILINLNGYTKYSRNEIFAMRPSPIQISFKGYPGTLGAPYMDYLIGDKVTTPILNQNQFSEKLIIMPHCYFMASYPISFSHVISDNYSKNFQREDRVKYGLPKDSFIFANFNHLVKVTPKIFDIWMKILSRVPNSVLWLLRLPKEGELNLKRNAEERGINGSRIIFTDFVPVKDHLLVKGLADLALDTIVFNGHGTGMDGLWAGLPVITLLGETLQSRALASYLTVLGLPELITNNLREYEDLAVSLALDSINGGIVLEKIRKAIKDQRMTSPLFDTKRWLRDWGVAMNLIWSRYESGLTPDHILVPEGTWEESIHNWIVGENEYVLDED